MIAGLLLCMMIVRHAVAVTQKIYCVTRALVAHPLHNTLTRAHPPAVNMGWSTLIINQRSTTCTPLRGSLLALGLLALFAGLGALSIGCCRLLFVFVVVGHFRHRAPLVS